MRRILFAVAGLVFYCPGLVLAADTQAFSVPEFVANEKEWDRLIGKPLRIEGRYSSLSPSAMRFHKCDLTFFLPPDFVRPVGRSKTMEVNGTLKREKRELVFRIHSLRLLQADQDTLLRKKGLLPKNNPLPWYELGKKTVRRGKFYEDRLLQQLGTKVLLDGIQIEKKQQKNISPDFLLELAAKSATLGLKDRVRVMLIFESCQLQMTTALKIADYDLSKLRTLMEKQLPGSTIPLTSLEGVVFDQYRKDKHSTYEQATDHARRQISRLFYLEVLREEYVRRLKKNGSNGDSIASGYETIAPDDPATAASFREQALMFRSQNIISARRNEVLEVARQYREQSKEQQAITALKTWLNYRASQLDKAGPSDYLATALDYEQWFSDAGKSEELLLAGIKRFPEDGPLRAQLIKRDYVKQKDQWVSRKTLPKNSLSKIQKAMQSGRIVKGMTRKQVANSLGGPKSVSRIASARQTVLVWNYPDAQLAIRFTQRSKISDYVVVAVNTLSTR